ALVKQVQVDLLKSEQYDYVSLADIQAHSTLKTNLFDHIFVFQNYPMDTPPVQEQPAGEQDFVVTTVKGTEQTSFGLNVFMGLSGSRLFVKLNYNAEAYQDESMKQLIRHLTAILEQIAETPDMRLAEIELASEAEKHQLLETFNATAAEYPQDQPIHTLFEEQADRTPEAVAVVFEAVQLTYGQLNAKANQLAHELRSRGVGADQIVGIMADRSVEMIVGILAILKAGGAYMPIDPAYPPDRMTYMLEDSGANLLLIYGGNVEVPLAYVGTVLNLADASLYTGEPENLPAISGASDLAYVIYTSGSTGQPKGVMVEHRGITNMMTALQRQYPCGE
ncbi:AMP-binding protein, partial [Paenibacillus xylanexedens]|uniref:AMP-binding protein n=1 Tax=Paenibacillus xylanexedens TaxID=528191 RepID=UPI0011A72BCA